MANEPSRLQITIPAVPSAITTVTDAVTGLLQAKRWPEPEIMAVELALQEAVANAVRHGCQNDPAKQVQCCVTCDDEGQVVIVVRDPGDGFDYTTIPNPLEPGNQLKPSGRGLFLINGLMDQVGFADGGRELQMRKQRSSPSVLPE
jgi:serine/threonine-protein kinase RsbW